MSPSSGRPLRARARVAGTQSPAATNFSSSMRAIRSGSARSVTYPGAARVLSSDMTRFHGLLTAALLGALVGCDASGLGGPRERTLLVQDHAVECTGVSLQLCLLVKDPSTQQF